MRIEEIKKRGFLVLQNPRLLWARNFILFIALVLIIYSVLRFWQEVLFYWPFADQVSQYSNLMARNLVFISGWIFHSLLKIGVRIVGTQVDFPNNYSMIIGEYCSGFKQTLIFMILLLVIPGPWRKKVWFIPLGIVILHLTNILRVTFSGLTLAIKPELFGFVHDQLFKTIYFAVIFFLWLWWVEVISRNKTTR
jgi:exosortase/archaeosortase family protein